MPRSRSKCGISPVIAVVILVAIAVVLVASLSGFASSLVGTYSYTPMVSVESLEIREDGTGKIIFYNSGARSDAVVALQVVPNSPMDLIPGEDISVNYSDDVTDGGGTGGNEDSNNPGPKCTLHSDDGNCMHDQDRGQSEFSEGHQNSPGGGTNGIGNSGSNTSNSGGQGNGPDGNNGLKKGSIGIFLPPNSETDIAWDETSVGEFEPGDMITVQIYLESGNRLTFSTIVS